jgi:stress response protein YsnF
MEKKNINNIHKASEVKEVLKERLVITKKEVVTGKVTIQKKVYEDEVPYETSGFKEEAIVDVKKIGKIVDAMGPSVREEGDTTIFSVYREELVKQVVLIEEIHVTKKKIKQFLKGSEILKREEIEISRSTKQ